MEKVIVTSEAEIRLMLREEIQKALSEIPKKNNADNNDDFITIEGASEFTSIAVATLYDYTHKKKIPFNKVGKKLIFSKKQLSEWIIAHRKKTKQEIESS